MLHIAHIAQAVAAVIMYIFSVEFVSQHFLLQLSNNLAIVVW